ncbi:MAG: twin-arginine translocation signal domain-containing protein, partial [Pseudomonadota bacterium]|nr:twin-arginine translocation signal domain-containing protein [Pseudomonadota bacterium]
MTKKAARRDRELGMDRPISRRDFINGIALGATALVGSPGFASPPEQAQASIGAAQDQPAYYPPTLTGLRGSHPGSFEAAHALRDGPTSPAAIDNNENYDL